MLDWTICYKKPSVSHVRITHGIHIFLPLSAVENLSPKPIWHRRREWMLFKSVDKQFRTWVIMDWKFTNFRNQIKYILQDTEIISWRPNCVVVRGTKSWSMAWQWKGSPGPLSRAEPAPAAPAQAPCSFLLFRAEKEFEWCQPGFGHAIWRYSALLKKHVRQSASCQVRLLSGVTKTQSSHK